MLAFFIRLIKWRMGYTETDEAPRRHVPYIPAYMDPAHDQIHNPDPSRIQITWVGHATFLIQVAGHTILTDPIWSERASPVSWLGPKRQARPGIAWGDLPKIDTVLISHTHYDHLDRPTIQKLGAIPQYVVPRGVGKWFASQKISSTTELSWWQNTRVGSLSITAVPANHWSKRNLFGTSGAGWGGYVVETPVGSIYFAGDTGAHNEYFKEIGKRFPSIDLSLIPIGAYYPQWIFGRYHVDPRDAVVIHKEVGSKKSIGMHWGTFKLTEEPMHEPSHLLAAEAALQELAHDAFVTFTIGETRIL